MVSVPLFTGYVFVKIDDRDLTRVRYTFGVINFIYFIMLIKFFFLFVEDTY